MLSSLVVSAPGDIKHLESNITLSADTSVSTSLVARKAGLPVLKAGVHGFARLWPGSASANALALTGEIKASDDLLIQL